MSRLRTLRTVCCVAVCVFCLARSDVNAVIIDVPGTELTIQSGIDAASDGDTVRVAPGAYSANLDFSGKQICVMSSGGAEVTIIVPAVTSAPAIVCSSGEPIGTQFLGFTLTGSADLGPPLISISVGSSLTVQYCIFRDNPVDNVVIACIGSGILIRYNVFTRNGGNSCIGVSAGTTSILNNSFDGNNRGLYCIGGLARASNNIISNCTEYAVFGVFAEMSYNNLWNNTTDYSGGATAGPSSIFTDPLFSDPAQLDYTLQAESPCIDAGNPDPSYDDPDGSRSDIGGIPLGGYFVQPPRAEELTIGTSGDNQHVVSHAPQMSWSYADNWGLPHTASEVEVGTDDQWTVAELWDPPMISGNATTATYDGASLQDGNSYFARVRVFNDTLWSEWQVVSFRMNTRPGPCELLFPPHDAILLTPCPTLVAMNSSDAEGDALQYDFFVSLDEEHMDIVAIEYGVPEGFGQTDWTVYGLTAENERHWWRARASDGFEKGTWSEPRLFWLDGYNNPPGPFGLLSPADGETGVSQQPTLQWEPAPDPDPGAAPHYTVTVANNPDFTASTEAAAEELTTLLWPHLLSTQTQYWWKVTADDGRGGTSVSDVWSFQTSNLCIPCQYQSDFDGDGYSTALDIGFLVDILFLGSPDIQDPGCAVTRADFDCDGYTTALDLGGLIDYLFIGGPEPCDPCSL